MDDELTSVRIQVNDYAHLDAKKSTPISPAGIQPTSAPAIADIKAKAEKAANGAKVHRPAAQQPIVPPQKEAADAAAAVGKVARDAAAKVAADAKAAVEKGKVEADKAAVAAASEAADPLMSEAPKFRPAPSHSFGHSIVSREEKIEYRDQDGNLLDEAAVKALEGKVSFKTRYETRTRLIDGSGNEIGEQEAHEAAADKAPVAPPHPDEEGVDPETKPAAEESIIVEKPAEVKPEGVKEDIKKEEAIQEKIEEMKEAQPASDVEEATVPVAESEAAPAAEL